MNRRVFIACLTVLAAACGDDSPTAPSLPPTGTAPYSQTDLVVGTGAEVQPNQTQRLTVVYTGWLYSDTASDHKGTIFNGPNAVAQFSLNEVIPGWRQGIPGMRVGGVRRLVIPPELAYGSTTPDPERIPPNATLLFEVELISMP